MARAGPVLCKTRRRGPALVRVYTLRVMDLKPIRRKVSPKSAEQAAMAPLCAVFRRFLKSRDLKYTPERADILNAVIDRDGTFEVDELLNQMRTRGYSGSKATVYRTIKLLQDAGIITQALFDVRQSHYQLAYGREPRDVMVCMKTGRQLEFTNEDIVALRNRICRKNGWDPVGHRFQIYAVSPEGRALNNESSPE